MSDAHHLRCRPCGHVWPGFHTPMEMGKLARLLKGAACPKCGERRELYLATPQQAAAALLVTEGGPPPNMAEIEAFQRYTDHHPEES